MKKFEIFTERFEFNFWGKRIPELSESDIYRLISSENCFDPQRCERFNTLEEAREHFNANYSGMGRTYAQRGSANSHLLIVDMSYIEENDYTVDEDGEEEHEQSYGVYADNIEPFPGE